VEGEGVVPFPRIRRRSQRKSVVEGTWSEGIDGNFEDGTPLHEVRLAGRGKIARGQGVGRLVVGLVVLGVGTRVKRSTPPGCA